MDIILLGDDVSFWLIGINKKRGMDKVGHVNRYEGVKIFFLNSEELKLVLFQNCYFLKFYV